MRRKKIYAMMKLATPIRVTLPNGRTFVERYKRIKRSELPLNIVMRRTYRDWAAVDKRRVRRQQGQEIFDLKNKTLKRILNSDAAHLALSKAIKTANNRLDGWRNLKYRNWKVFS